MRKFFAILALAAFGAFAGCETADDTCVTSITCSKCTVEYCCDAYPSVKCWYSAGGDKFGDDYTAAQEKCGCS